MSSSLRPARHARAPSIPRSTSLSIPLLAACLLTGAVPALAKSPEPAAAPAGAADAKPQNRMARCSADFKASGRPGAERKDFMSQCLRKTPAAPAGKS